MLVFLTIMAFGGWGTAFYLLKQRNVSIEELGAMRHKESRKFFESNGVAGGYDA